MKVKYCCSLLTMFCLGISIPSQANNTPLQPNIIFILADDLGPGILGSMRQKIIKTPHIDQLGKQGMMFTRAYSSQYCCPARASFLQGVHTRYKNSYSQTQGGLEITRDQQGWTVEELNTKAKNLSTIKPTDNEVFLPQLLQKAGYATGQFGKLDWGFMTYHDELVRHGWDHYVGYYDHVKAHGFYPPYLWKNGTELILEGNTHIDSGKTVESYGKNSTVKRQNKEGKVTYAPDIFLKETLHFMKAHQNKPFFVFFSTNLPHGPVDIPLKDNIYRGNQAIRDMYQQATGNNEECYSAAEEYASMVHKLDQQVGLLVKEAQEIYKKTKRPSMVIFSSDNGHEIYYRADKQHLTRTNSYHGGKLDSESSLLDVFQGNQIYDTHSKSYIPLAGLKWTNYEGGTRVPLIIWCPSLVPAGKENSRLTPIYDHFATFADIAGVNMPRGKDSKSYYDSLTKGQDTQTHDFIIIDNAIITRDQWKLIKGKQLELFHLKNDPEERKNLISENPKKAQELLSLYISNTGKNRRDQ